METVDSVIIGDWNRGLIVGIIEYVITLTGSQSPILYLSYFLPLTAPLFFLYQPVVSFSITFFLLLLPPISSSTPHYDLPVYLGKQITAAGQELPNVSINILSTQSRRLTGPQQTSLFVNGQQWLFTACSFVIRLNQTDWKCLTDQEQISESDLYPA